MSTTEEIAATTSTATSSDISVPDGASIQIWTDLRLVDNERVDIFRTDGGSVEAPLIEGGTVVALTKSKSAALINGPGTFRLKKTATTAAKAVLYDS